LSFSSSISCSSLVKSSWLASSLAWIAAASLSRHTERPRRGSTEGRTGTGGAAELPGGFGYEVIGDGLASIGNEPVHWGCISSTDVSASTVGRSSSADCSVRVMSSLARSSIEIVVPLITIGRALAVRLHEPQSQLVAGHVEPDLVSSRLDFVEIRTW